MGNYYPQYILLKLNHNRYGSWFEVFLRLELHFYWSDTIDLSESYPYVKGLSCTLGKEHGLLPWSHWWTHKVFDFGVRVERKPDFIKGFKSSLTRVWNLYKFNFFFGYKLSYKLTNEKVWKNLMPSFFERDEKFQ